MDLSKLKREEVKVVPDDLAEVLAQTIADYENRSGKTLEEVLPEIEQIAQTESAISFFVEFFKRSTRGIIR